MARRQLLLGTIFDPCPTDPRGLNSVKLDGAGERYFAVDTLAMGNDWSFSQWFAPDPLPIVSINEGLLTVNTIVGGAAQIIRLAIGDFGASAPLGSLFILTRTQANAGIKTFVWDAVFTAGAWTHLLFTWTGNSTLDLYIDGVLTAPSTKISDGSGAMSSTGPIQLAFGAFGNTASGTFSGNVGPFGIWDTAVSAAEAAQIFECKFSMDLRNNLGNYVSSSSLIGYWRPGFDDEGFTDLVAGVMNFGEDGLDPTHGIDLTNIEVNSP